MRVDKCVPAVRVAETPAFTYLRSSCNYMSEVEGPQGLLDCAEGCRAKCRGFCGCNPAIRVL